MVDSAPSPSRRRWRTGDRTVADVHSAGALPGAADRVSRQGKLAYNG